LHTGIKIQILKRQEFIIDAKVESSIARFSTLPKIPRKIKRTQLDKALQFGKSIYIHTGRKPFLKKRS